MAIPPETSDLILFAKVMMANSKIVAHVHGNYTALLHKGQITLYFTIILRKH